MKYSLKNEYKELLNEEIVNIERFEGGNRSEVWDIKIEDNDTISYASKVDVIKKLSGSTDGVDDQTSIDIIKQIIENYSTISLGEITNFISSEREKDPEFKIRITPSNDISFIISHLNKHFKSLCLGANKKKSQIGIGELPIHLAFNTSNYNTSQEPDAVIETKSGQLNISIKSFRDKDILGGLGRGVARTGESEKESIDIINKIIEINNIIKPDLQSSSPTTAAYVEEYCAYATLEQCKNLLKEINDLKLLIITEHNANYVIVWTGNDFDYIESNQNNIDKISIKKFHKNRAHFSLTSSLSITPAEISNRFLNYDDFLPYVMGSKKLGFISDIAESDENEYTAEDIETARNLLIKMVELAIASKGAQDRFIKLFNDYEDFFNSYSSYYNNNKSYKITSGQVFYKEILELRNKARSDFDKQVYKSPDPNTIQSVFENIVKKHIDLKSKNPSLDMSSYVPQGKVLKEIYPYLFKKKLISEGGLAGHMMHPYEALDMTPRQIIDRIKEYSTSQKIIEKVDGQNLFFTVEEDGTLMFARNKEDMTHDDLVAKFTGHGAEKPFVEGGNAIKRGVEQWLQSAGPAAEMEIREVFHPDGETKSFINFEIMHPDKPNQIVYDEKYIVFHSIVDYVDGRKTIHSTNKGQRLEKIIRLMDSGISSAGFTLASNRTVNLNELTSVQIEDYVERIKEVALSLGIPEDITLGEGIENIIKQEIDDLGIEMDREKLKMLYDFVLYGEDRQGNKIKSKDFTAAMLKSDVTGLRSLDLTSSNKALKKVQDIISPFKDVFVDLGVDLLKGVKSAYMSDETNQKNIELLRDKLQTAMNDLIDYMNEKPENYWEAEVHRLRPYLDKVIDKDITDIVATTVEGGVYDYQGDLIKVTGGFAPLNQILGAAYRDKKGIFPTFKEKFMQQESNRRSLKNVFNLIY